MSPILPEFLKKDIKKDENEREALTWHYIKCKA